MLATCYPSFMEKLSADATTVESRVQLDGQVVTSRGPGTAMVYAVALVERLYGKEKADEVAGPMIASKCSSSTRSVSDDNIQNLSDADLRLAVKLLRARWFGICIVKVVRIFVQNHQAPYLRTLQDVSGFVTRAAYGSESEANDEAATTSLASELGKANRAS
ncbi:hypothetical protein Syun_021771 [Stephania yunnanensis]|uniref:DJ-1/PfpI domain-containing protein n=1 Tax=Stephania yunnanensis TaxID=152371 RepID=A0AAP0IG74_9MAGN